MEKLENLKDLLSSKEKIFLSPEKLSTLGAILCDYQRSMFEKVSQCSSDTFNSENYEETACDLHKINDANESTTLVTEILRLKLRIERETVVSSQ